MKEGNREVTQNGEQEKERERDPGPVLPGVVQAVCVQEDDGRSRVHVGTRPPFITPESKPSSLPNSPASLSLVKEQPAHPAELAGKPPPERTKVFIVELLKLRGLADVT